MTSTSRILELTKDIVDKVSLHFPLDYKMCVTNLSRSAVEEVSTALLLSDDKANEAPGDKETQKHCVRQVVRMLYALISGKLVAQGSASFVATLFRMLNPAGYHFNLKPLGIDKQIDVTPDAFQTAVEFCADSTTNFTPIGIVKLAACRFICWRTRKALASSTEEVLTVFKKDMNELGDHVRKNSEVAEIIHPANLGW